MKNKLLISIILLVILLPVGAHVLARQAPASPATASQENPCNDQASDSKKKDTIDYEPLVDPVEMARLRAQKKMEEKNFKEMQEAATDLAAVSKKMSQEIDTGGQFVVSLRVLDELDQIEKLTKKVRSRAK